MKRPSKYDRNCHRPHCPCTHDGECFRGWMDRNVDGRDVTVPCPTCRPEQYRTVNHYGHDREELQMMLTSERRLEALKATKGAA